MSTRAPAPLYAYSRTHGFRPLDSEPEKSGGGLMNRLDRWLNPKSTTESSATDSTAAESLENASTATSETQPEGSPAPIPIRVLTWNIWFESLIKSHRTSALISTIKSLNPLPDVCCFQECTAGFEAQIQEDDWWRKTWAMTKCQDQFSVTGFHYGTMLFVRMELVDKMEYKARTWFEPFEVTQTGRGLLVVELTPPKTKHPLLIATTHMDYTPEIRATQFNAGISTLSATPTSIFCGDTNIDTYPELQPLLSTGYVDSWLEMHPNLKNSPDLRAVGVTFGTVGLRGESFPDMDDGPDRRLDYVMTRGMKVVSCRLVGEELIPKEKWVTCPQEAELDLEVYVSDHLGVLVDVELA